MLLLSDGRKQYEKNIGSGNEFEVTNALTQYNVLYLQAYFFKGNDFRQGTNMLQFNLRRSRQGGSTLEVFVSAQIGTVTTTTLAPGSTATAAVDYTDSKLNFEFGIPGSGGGGTLPYTIGEGLKLDNNILSVDTIDHSEEDNTQPITSGAVYTEVGNIEALLKTI